jgi:hypothetical protein
MKLKPGEAARALLSNPIMSFSVTVPEESGSYKNFSAKDIAEYINHLEEAVMTLALKLSKGV